ncbi:hypothetical protein Pmani_035912 [Petrolisthes manimaculis]|uniref:Uncharacterized protein n=1 Tax=Petrolisthes manimaculis TaxID=1843537 RepID=A0AAE1NKM6_9EUCA|nr:hypothetical protein Pmani_035912 [Petrolisthes manimaculis]
MKLAADYSPLILDSRAGRGGWVDIYQGVVMVLLSHSHLAFGKTWMEQGVKERETERGIIREEKDDI